MNVVKQNRALLGLLVSLSIAVLAGCEAGKKAENNSGSSVPADWPRELVMCYLPNEATEEFAEYRNGIQGDLSAALGIRVTEVNAADYNAVVEAMRTRHADIASFGPVTYVQAVERAGVEAMVVVAPFGDKSQAGYTSKIIVKAGSPIRTLRDLRGKTFAFVDPASTSGNYVPTLELMNAFGMTNEDFHTNGKFFSSVSFSGRHQNGLQAVINGDVDAAPVASDILEGELAAGRVKESDFTVIHQSPLIPNAPISIRRDLPEDLKAKVKEFFLGYKDPDYFQFMLGWPPERKPEFVEANDRDLDYVRDLMAKVMPQ
ncbi:MAG: phosphate/phosphite/phosphonate ABC transporter substrate-binding protein [Spirochaetaceae bacterium]|jgi:phosphonate transport system substrate-binding protein|nr:phosphate/phosphite/phosphonate ABC transporter substrate-binding protein [Spirochaetaceae bacterium]